MSSCAILSAGPSVGKTWDDRKRGDYECVMAVNHAAMHYQHNIVVALDGFMVDRIAKSCNGPSFGLVYRSDLLGSYSLPANGLYLYDIRSIAAEMGVKKSHISFSVCAALYIACYLSYETVDVYGHDMRGVGFGVQRSYHHSRWEKESRLYDIAERYCREKGCSINRIKEHNDAEKQ